MILQDFLELFAETKKGDPWSNDILQYFMLENEYTSYFPIFTIQLSPLVPKELHSELWNTNMIAIITTDYMFAPLCYCACWYLQQHRNENKYICWLLIFIAHSLIKQWINNIHYVPEEFKWYPWYYLSSFYLYQYSKTV
jgi:hypothetical protein